MTPQEEQQIRQIIQEEISGFFGSDKFLFKKHIQLFDGRNIQLGKTTGTKFGKATDEKLSFHNSTPVIQRASADQTAVATTAPTQTTPWGYSSSAQALAIITLVNEIRAALVEKGLIKGSA